MHCGPLGAAALPSASATSIGCDAHHQRQARCAVRPSIHAGSICTLPAQLRASCCSLQRWQTESCSCQGSERVCDRCLDITSHISVAAKVRATLHADMHHASHRRLSHITQLSEHCDALY